MDFTNINDPAGVAALLDQLKSSSAWKDLDLSATTTPAQGVLETPVASSSLNNYSPFPNSVNTPLAPTQPRDEVASGPVLGSSIASLLSQLESYSTTSVDPPSNNAAYGRGEIQQSSAGLTTVPLLHPAPLTVLEPIEDRSNYTFRQSLPVISEMLDEPTFARTVKKMKADQDALERQLWTDREAIYAKYREKLKVTQTKARMIGGTVSQHELNMITDGFKKEIQKFDSERALPAWDGLISRQQQELSQLAVPTMTVTTESGHRERQQQVVGLMETLLGPKAA